MKYLFYLIMIVLLISSCVTKQEVYKPITFENETGYKNLYIVDTIKIVNPVIVTTRNNQRFIMAKEIFSFYKGDDIFFFENESIFIYEPYLPMSIPSDLFNKYAVGSSCSEYLVADNTVVSKKIDSVYKYEKTPDFFILLLIRGDYYNKVYTGMDSYEPIDLSNNKYLYYKIAIPFCL